VWASDRAVVKAASLKLKKFARTGRAHREARHAFYRQMLNYHHGDQRLVADFRL
jgi:hypothetical protein